MKCRCPHCKVDFELEHVLADNDIIAVIKLISSLGQLSDLAWAYLELFGVGPIFLKRKKVRVLLGEMKALYDAESFSFQRKKYRISKAGIGEALNIVVHRNFSSRLANHNYLKQVMIGIAEKEETVRSKQEESALRQKETDLRSGIRPQEADMEERRAIGLKYVRQFLKTAD